MRLVYIEHYQRQVGHPVDLQFDKVGNGEPLRCMAAPAVFVLHQPDVLPRWGLPRISAAVCP
jgi:hypothetical protein